MGRGKEGGLLTGDYRAARGFLEGEQEPSYLRSLGPEPAQAGAVLYVRVSEREKLEKTGVGHLNPGALLLP